MTIADVVAKVGWGMGALLGLLDRLLAVGKGVPAVWRDQKRKKTLRHLLVKDGYRWRSIGALSRAIGADEAKTKELLVSIGARGSVLEGKDMWTLQELGDGKDARAAADA